MSDCVRKALVTLTISPLPTPSEHCSINAQSMREVSFRLAPQGQKIMEAKELAMGFRAPVIKHNGKYLSFSEQRRLFPSSR